MQLTVQRRCLMDLQGDLRNGLVEPLTPEDPHFSSPSFCLPPGSLQLALVLSCALGCCLDRDGSLPVSLIPAVTRGSGAQVLRRIEGGSDARGGEEEVPERTIVALFNSLARACVSGRSARFWMAQVLEFRSPKGSWGRTDSRSE